MQCAHSVRGKRSGLAGLDRSRGNGMSKNLSGDKFLGVGKICTLVGIRVRGYSFSEALILASTVTQNMTKYFYSILQVESMLST